MRRYPVNSPLLRQDPVLPLFFVHEVPHPYCRGFEGQYCSSYANRHNKTLYYVSAGPYHGFFRYYSSAWAASTMVQGASVTSPTESLQDLVSKWFVFDSHSNVIAPPYLEPELGFDGDFSKCFGESLYSTITTVQRARSILRLAVWRTGNNGGCPILRDDPELTVLHKTHPPLAPPAVLAHQFDLSMAPPAGPSRSPAVHLVPPTYIGGTATPQQHLSLMGGGTQQPFHADTGGPVPSQGHQYHHPALSRSPSARPSDVPSYVHVSVPQSVTHDNPYVHVSPPQSVTQGHPSSTSSSFSVIQDEGSVATMIDTGHPTSAMNRMMLSMEVPPVPQGLALAPIDPATMLPR
jgi:hypothetical protein